MPLNVITHNLVRPDAVPLFSIITVCYNAADTIGRTLESVDRQTFTDYEHLIIDGASVDGTQKIVTQTDNSRRMISSMPDRGLYDAMNKGRNAANGEYLIFLNAGDKFHSPDTLKLIAQTIKENNKPGVVYGQTMIVDGKGRELGPRHLTAPENLTLKSFADGMVVCHQAFVAHNAIAPYFNYVKYKFSADYEWCIRCLQHSKNNIGLTDTIFIDYLNEGVTTRNRLPSLVERFRIMSYYYGFFPTVCRHIKFVNRWYNRRKNAQ